MIAARRDDEDSKRFAMEFSNFMLDIVCRIWLYVRVGVLVLSDIYHLLPTKPVRLLVGTIRVLVQYMSSAEVNDFGRVGGGKELNYNCTGTGLFIVGMLRVGESFVG